jgi:hypothetical protein
MQHVCKNVHMTPCCAFARLHVVTPLVHDGEKWCRTNYNNPYCLLLVWLSLWVYLDLMADSLA